MNRHDHNLSMTMPLTAVPEWVPGLIAPALGFVLSIAVAVGIVKTEVRNLHERAKEDKADEKELAAQLRDAVRTIQSVVTEVKVIIAEQGVINRVTTTALDGVVKKQEDQGKDIREIQQQLVLIREVMIGPCKPGKLCWRE